MKLLDLFSGIGGFHKGFEKAGFEFDWVGFSDIDKYASAVYKYRYPDAKELGDITSIRPERDLPDNIDILCGGFPCQAFSVAGRRKGFEDTRGTLFFEIARILRHFRDTEKPIPYFVLENVKGLLSHDDGRTFAIIYRVLTDIGYTVECQLLNTRWVLPQNRERIYIVGHFGTGSGCKVFPIGESGQVSYNRNTEVASTLQHPGHSEFLPTLVIPLNANFLILGGYYPKIESEYTLSDILEEEVDAKYFLSESQVKSLTTGIQKSQVHCNTLDTLEETTKE